MPIENGKYVNPGWVDNAPPSIDAAELNAMSDTLENLDAISGTGIKYSRFVIGTSTNGWTENDCDYLCDGIADEAEFNAAISAMPSGGGEIYVLSGRYNLSGQVSPFQYITIRGESVESVILTRQTVNGYGDESNAILVSSNGSSIRDLTYDGNKNLFTSGSPSDTTTEILCGGASVIDNVIIQSCINNAIWVEPITSSATIISNSIFLNIGGACVYADCDGTLEFYDCQYDATPQYVLEAYGQWFDGTAVKSGPLTVFMHNVVPIAIGRPILMNGTGFSQISHCSISTIQLINTVTQPSSGFSPERGRHILVGNQFSPTRNLQTVLTIGSGVNNCIIVANIFMSGSTTGQVQDNGSNNIIFNGTSGGQVTLSQSGWSGNSQTVQANGVTSNSIVTVGPIPGALSSATQYGVYCSSQGNGTLTFTCTSVPSSSLTYSYTSQEAF